MRALPRALGLSFIALSCAGGAPRNSERAPAPSPAVTQKLDDEPAPASTADAEAPSVPPVEHAESAAADAATCRPAGPPLAERVCADSRLDALLAELGKADPGFEGFVRCEPLSLRDFERVALENGKAGDLDAGPRFFGDQDFNRDRKRDVVLLFTSVDYWSWFMFVRGKDCLRFIGAVEGYQVELLPSVHHGLRDLRVFTYPLQGRLETHEFDGTRFTP